MNRLRKLVTFNLDDEKFALYVEVVQRVIRVVAVTPLPKAPDGVAGIIDLQGRMIPVFDLRRRFGLPARTMALSDQMIIAATTTRLVAILVDSVDDVIEIPEAQIATAEEILPGIASVAGVIRTESGPVFIHDLDALLSLQEESALCAALDADASDHHAG